MYLTGAATLYVDVESGAKVVREGWKGSPLRVKRPTTDLDTLIHIVRGGSPDACRSTLSPPPTIDLGLEADVHA
jgi:hypothetical protein